MTEETSHPRLNGLIGWIIALLMVCAPARAQILAGADAAATVSELQGSVSVLKHGEEWALFPGDEVQVGQTIVTGDDGFARLEVADGSFFLVFPDSHVVFRKNPASLRDLIDVFLGRVKVYIEHFGDAPNPHKVYTPTAVISVRGTTFDVIVDETETVVVQVEEGLVTVRHRLMPSEDASLSAGDQLVIHPSVPIAKAGADKQKIVAVMDRMARTAASIWRRSAGGTGGSGGGPTGGAGGGSTPLPTDEEAPAPPPAPPPPPSQQ